MNSVFDSPRQKLAYGRERISEFKESARAYFDTNLRRVVELNPVSKWREWKFKLDQPLPSADLIHVVETAVSSLRSALDHAICAVAIACGCPNTRNAFPFPTAAENVEKELGRCCRDIPRSFWPIVGECRPYNGGDDNLWAFNLLSNKLKHVILASVGAVSPGTVAERLRGSMDLTIPGHKWDAAKREVVLMRVGPGSRIVELDWRIKFLITIDFPIDFDGVEALRGKDVLALLEPVAGKVESILSAIEGEARRLALPLELPNG